MLLQRKANNFHLMYCVSKKTTEAENKCHSTRLELMAIVWCVDRLWFLLLGIHFTVVTDCQALIYLNAQRTQKPQIAHWCDLIQEYDFIVKHRPGKRMKHVDWLSQEPVECPSDTMDGLLEKRFDVCLTCSLEDQIVATQRGDEQLRQLIQILEQPELERSTEDKNRTKDYVLKDGRLMRIIDCGSEMVMKLVSPKHMRQAVDVRCHDLLGHFSVDRTVAKIQETFWFPRMRNYVRKHVSECFECIFNKVLG